MDHSILTDSELRQCNAFCDKAANDELTHLLSIDVVAGDCEFNYNRQAYVEACSATIAAWQYEAASMGLKRQAHIDMLINHYTGA